MSTALVINASSASRSGVRSEGFFSVVRADRRRKRQRNVFPARCKGRHVYCLFPGCFCTHRATAMKPDEGRGIVDGRGKAQRLAATYVQQGV
jgi:hypothetical protein